MYDHESLSDFLPQALISNHLFSLLRLFIYSVDLYSQITEIVMGRIFHY